MLTVVFHFRGAVHAGGGRAGGGEGGHEESFFAMLPKGQLSRGCKITQGHASGVIHAAMQTHTLNPNQSVFSHQRIALQKARTMTGTGAIARLDYVHDGAIVAVVHYSRDCSPRCDGTDAGVAGLGA